MAVASGRDHLLTRPTRDSSSDLDRANVRHELAQGSAFPIALPVDLPAGYRAPDPDGYHYRQTGARYTAATLEVHANSVAHARGLWTYTTDDVERLVTDPRMVLPEPTTWPEPWPPDV